jgi:hypothetical protein
LGLSFSECFNGEFKNPLVHALPFRAKCGNAHFIYLLSSATQTRYDSRGRAGKRELMISAIHAVPGARSHSNSPRRSEQLLEFQNKMRVF